MSTNNKEENIKKNQKSDEDSNLEEAKLPDKNKEESKEKTNIAEPLWIYHGLSNDPLRKI